MRSGRPLRHLILEIAGTNDAAGKLDIDVHARTNRTALLYRRSVAAGMNTQILISGGIQTGSTQRFNPTTTPHWKYVAASLTAAGIPAAAIVTPGIPALHTVHEATMTHAVLQQASAALGTPPGELALPEGKAGVPAYPDRLSIVVSAFHYRRVEFLFGLALGHCSGLPRALSMRLERVPDAMAGTALRAREAHEAQAVHALRTAPQDPWRAFALEHGMLLPGAASAKLANLSKLTYAPRCIDGRGRPRHRFTPSTQATPTSRLVLLVLSPVLLLICLFLVVERAARRQAQRQAAAERTDRLRVLSSLHPTA